MGKYIPLIFFWVTTPAVAAPTAALPLAFDQLVCLSQQMPPKISVSSFLDKTATAETAYDTAFLSALAYEDNDTVKTVGKDLGFTTIEFFDKRVDRVNWQVSLRKIFFKPIFANTHAIWLENDDLIVVSFRGTELNLISTLIADLEAKQIPMLDAKQAPLESLGLVHAGFYNSLMIVWDQLNARLIGSKPKPLFIIGHSMGGAIATIMAARLMEEEFKLYAQSLKSDFNAPLPTWNTPYVAGLFTIGSPEVGNETFRDTIDQYFIGKPPIQIAGVQALAPLSRRYINEDDFVTQLPGLRSYYHIDTGIRLMADGTTALADTATDTHPLSRQIRIDAEHERLRAALHLTISYISKMLRQLTGKPAQLCQVAF